MKKHRQEVAFMWNDVLHKCHGNISREFTLESMDVLEARLKENLMISLYRCLERVLNEELRGG